MSRKRKLTWSGKGKRSKLKQYILLEALEKSCDAKQRASL